MDLKMQERSHEPRLERGFLIPRICLLLERRREHSSDTLPLIPNYQSL
jgi:hypothetical protein